MSDPYGYPQQPYPQQSYPQQPYPQQAAPYGSPMMAAQPRSTSGMAIGSLVCSLLGLFVPLLSILAVIFGHIALSQIKKSNGMVGGRGLAIAGLIIGYITIALVVIFVGFIVLAVVLAPGGGTTSLITPRFF